MKFNILSLAALIAGVLQSCASPDSGKKPDAQVSMLDEYLEERFHSHIPKDSSLLVLISSTGCKGCIELTISKLNNNPKTTFIVSNHTYNDFKEYFDDNDKILIDSTDRVSRLPYHKGNVAIVKVSQGSIDTVIRIIPNTAEEQLNGI